MINNLKRKRKYIAIGYCCQIREIIIIGIKLKLYKCNKLNKMRTKILTKHLHGIYRLISLPSSFLVLG